jgi:hypothetical protein
MGVMKRGPAPPDFPVTVSLCKCPRCGRDRLLVKCKHDDPRLRGIDCCLHCGDGRVTGLGMARGAVRKAGSRRAKMQGRGKRAADPGAGATDKNQETNP